MDENNWLKTIFKITTAVIAIGVFCLAGFKVVYAGKIYPNVKIGVVDVGGLNKEEAIAKIEQRIKSLEAEGIGLNIDGKRDEIHAIDLSTKADYFSAVDSAMSVGRNGDFLYILNDLLRSPFVVKTIELPINISQHAYDAELQSLLDLYAEPGNDVRLSIDRTVVSVLYDVKPGYTLDLVTARQQLYKQLNNLDNTTIIVPVVNQEPKIDSTTADAAIEAAERMLAEPIKLKHSWRIFTVDRATIGGWITSGSEGNRLTAEVDEQALAKYVAGLGDTINNLPETADIKLDVNGKVVSFVPPTAGEVLEEDETVKIIKDVLTDRRDQVGVLDVTELTLPVAVKKPRVTGTAAELGIQELIGVATTSFAGSPTNRRYNIANGVKFLTGSLVAPGEEFSTIKTLGVIDNTTGYLPELVIKGNRTLPEFGGGLCQVSTTLFRSVLNAGLPVTARRNHSYRVGYYEKDGNGNYIGPGLDATIYDPAPDFKFKNDTENHILVRGYVHGDLITFELYGTKDGRSAFVDGPHTLTTTPAGEPIYVETDELPAGETKRVETAHAGGTAVATYKVVYADGSVVEQEFNSFYRPWPEQYLVGAGTDPATYLSEEKLKELEAKQAEVES